jgi:hypothetical protein
MKFLDVEVKTGLIFHGFDSNNQAIQEEVSEEAYVRKLVSLDRVRSISEQYILVTGADGREMYWEFKGSLDDLKNKLKAIGVDIA